MFPSVLEDRYAEFADVRESYLLNFGYNTARAYWADLEDILFWADGHGLDPLRLSANELRKYQALLRRRRYRPSTIRRRMTAYRGLRATMSERDCGFS